MTCFNNHRIFYKCINKFAFLYIIGIAFVKDPNLSLDETLDTLVISQNEVKMPEKLAEKERQHV